MVGIPRSTGCATCKKRKIKCDEARPSCLKCLNSGWACPGYHIQMTFKNEGTGLGKKYGMKQKYSKPDHLFQISKEQKVPVVRASSSSLVAKGSSIQSLALSPLDKLVNGFYQTLKPDLQTGRSLTGFGKFMTEVPLHIGFQEAYDLAVESVSLAHGAVLTRSECLLVRSQRSYGQALYSLQRSLESRDLARSSETLAATVLLSVYELLVGTDRTASIKHAGGYSALIRMKGPSGFKDPFALQLLTSLRARIVIDAIVSKKPCFLDSPPWKAIFLNVAVPEDDQAWNSFFSLCSEVPAILEHFRTLSPSPQNPFPPNEALTTLRNRTAQLRSRMQSWRSSYSLADLQLLRHTSPPLDPYSHTSTASYSSNRANGLHCTYAAVTILLNSTLLNLPPLSPSPSSSSTNERAALQQQNVLLAAQICDSYEFAARFSPFGNLHMEFALHAAYLAVAQAEEKAWIKSKLAEMRAALRGSQCPDSIVSAEGGPFGFLDLDFARGADAHM